MGITGEACTFVAAANRGGAIVGGADAVDDGDDEGARL